MLHSLVESLFTTHELYKYDLSILDSLGLPTSLMAEIHEQQRIFSSKGAAKHVQLSQSWAGFDDFNEVTPNYDDETFIDDYEDEEEDTTEAASDYYDENSWFFSRTDPFTEEEQRAIDQKGFLWPDYCVCMRPDLI